MSEKQWRDKIASIKREQGAEEGRAGKARASAGKHRAEAGRRVGKITSRTSESMVRSHKRAAEAAEGKAVAEDGKVTAATKKLGRLATEMASAESSLAREVQTSSRRDDSGRKATARRAQQDEDKRRQDEKRHAHEIARLSRTRVIHEIREVPVPRPETLKVLYLTANPDPEKRLRVDVEVRQVQQAVKAALHRDLIEIHARVAAIPEDLLDGLNDLRPHVVHFSGHAGHEALAFDNASVDTPEERQVSFDRLGQALAATSSPPVLLVLNGCDTLEGAEVLLTAVPVVVGMSAEITDLAAVTFAARFYGALAAAQPVDSALAQGVIGIEFQGLDEAWKPNVLVRDGVALSELVLVKVPPV